MRLYREFWLRAQRSAGFARWLDRFRHHLRCLIAMPYNPTDFFYNDWLAERVSSLRVISVL
ncbi:hypothetical protein [Paraburkholderia youngii]|uniref:hypothetical protein n=1 Tax=Paraburkholderia sp. BR10954 TaxID=3236995 RepID=UPI0015958578